MKSKMGSGLAGGIMLLFSTTLASAQEADSLSASIARPGHEYVATVYRVANGNETAPSPLQDLSNPTMSNPTEAPDFGTTHDEFLAKKLPPAPDSAASSWTLLGDSDQTWGMAKKAAPAVLAISLSLLALFLLKKSPAGRRGGLPEDVVSVIGQSPFGANQKLQLIRLGSKLLLVTTTPSGTHTLGEITDPEEVLQIESVCRHGKFDTIGQTLRNRIANPPSGSPASSTTRERSSRTLLEA